MNIKDANKIDEKIVYSKDDFEKENLMRLMSDTIELADLATDQGKIEIYNTLGDTISDYFDLHPEEQEKIDGDKIINTILRLYQVAMNQNGKGREIILKQAKNRLNRLSEEQIEKLKELKELFE